MRRTRLWMLAPLVIAAVYACTGSDPDSPIVIRDGVDASSNGSSGSSGTSGGDPPAVYTGSKFCDSLDGGAICEDFDHGPASEHGWTVEDEGGGTIAFMNDGGAMSALLTIPKHDDDTDVRARFSRSVTAVAGMKSWTMDADMRLVAQGAIAGALVFHFEDAPEADIAALDFDTKPALAFAYVDPNGAETSFPFSTGTWHHVQLRLAIPAGGTKPTFELTVDGARQATLEELAVPSKDTRVDFGLSGNASGDAVTIEIDNLVYRVE